MRHIIMYVHVNGNFIFSPELIDNLSYGRDVRKSLS